MDPRSTKLIQRVEAELKTAEYFSPESCVITVTEAKKLLALCETMAAGLGDDPPQRHKDQYAWTVAKNAAEEAGLWRIKPRIE